MGGQVRSIHSDNAIALAKVLDCQVSDLIVANEADQMASVEDQKRAAALITTSSLIDKLGPIGEWNVIEAMLKATIVPNLPVNILAEVYNQLAVASWRQSKIDQADLYNQKAEELARRSGDQAALGNALLSKANIFSWRGKTDQSIQTYKVCLSLETYLTPRTIGSVFSNLGAVLYESGHLEEGEDLQEKAIEAFSFDGTPTNLSIAWCHLAMINLEREQVAQLVTHVFGEHLGRWQDGIKLLTDLSKKLSTKDQSECAPAIKRSIAGLEVAEAKTLFAWLFRNGIQVSSKFRADGG